VSEEALVENGDGLGLEMAVSEIKHLSIFVNTNQ
jgi:hypothetical protein